MARPRAPGEAAVPIAATPVYLAGMPAWVPVDRGWEPDISALPLHTADGRLRMVFQGDMLNVWVDKRS